MPKVLFQLYIDVEQFNYIDQKSKQTGHSRAALVREMIDYYRKEEKAQEENLLKRRSRK